jgi:hypothetical protein
MDWETSALQASHGNGTALLGLHISVAHFLSGLAR